MKKAAAKSTYTGKRAPHDMKGDMAMVSFRSRSSSSVRVAITAGTVQPNPTSIGTNAFPGRPMLRMKRSITKAARAM